MSKRRDRDRRDDRDDRRDAEIQSSDDTAGKQRDLFYHQLLHDVLGLVTRSSEVTADSGPSLSPFLSNLEDANKTEQLLSSVRDNWSGRGSHAIFKKGESIPLKTGRTLGYGMNGEVVEITCKDIKLALKKIRHRLPTPNVQVKEIDIMKNLKHRHVVRLIGTYTQRPYLGLLIWPVARCNLSSVLELLDIRDSSNQEWAQSQEVSEKLAEHDFSIEDFQDLVGQDQERIWSIFGCLTAAMVYLHQNNIRHKDIKPSNILLAKNGLWLTDFGAAKDFTSDLTSTSESRERGTLRYSAPEVFNYEESGRSADIFSLGCVFLETAVVLTHTHTLADLEELRPSKSKSYEANLDQTDKWLALVDSTEMNVQHLLYEIKQMLNRDRTRRPTAEVLASRLSSIDQYNGGQLSKRFHSFCCDLWPQRDLDVHRKWIEKLGHERHEHQRLNFEIQQLLDSALRSAKQVHHEAVTRPLRVVPDTQVRRR